MRLPAALLGARDLIVTLGIRLVPLFIMAGLTLVSFWFLQKNTQDEALLTPAKKKHEPDYIFINAKLTVLNLDGSTKYRLLGKEFKHYADDASIDVKVPRLRLFNSKSPPLTIQAKTGQINGDLDIVELFDQAEVSRPQQLGTTGAVIDPSLLLSSNYLKVFVNEDRLITHLPVLIERGESVMTASQGAVYNNIDQSISMRGDVKGSIAASDTNRNSLR